MACLPKYSTSHPTTETLQLMSPPPPPPQKKKKQTPIPTAARTDPLTKPCIKTQRKAVTVWTACCRAGPRTPGMTHAGTVPRHKAVTSAQSGGVELENGGDVAALGHGDQGVQHLLLGVPQPAPRRVLIGVRLRRESRPSRTPRAGRVTRRPCCAAHRSGEDPVTPAAGRRGATAAEQAREGLIGRPHRVPTPCLLVLR